MLEKKEMWFLLISNAREDVSTEQLLLLLRLPKHSHGSYYPGYCYHGSVETGDNQTVGEEFIISLL